MKLPIDYRLLSIENRKHLNRLEKTWELRSNIFRSDRLQCYHYTARIPNFYWDFYRTFTDFGHLDRRSWDLDRLSLQALLRSILKSFVHRLYITMLKILISSAIRHAENEGLFLYFRRLRDNPRRTDKFVRNQLKPVKRVHLYRLE